MLQYRRVNGGIDYCTPRFFDVVNNTIFSGALHELVRCPAFCPAVLLPLA